MNTCYPDRIISFDVLTQTEVVKLVIERLFSDLSSNYQSIPAKELVDVPCHFPKGGGHSITMPVVAGDDCLVFFAQRGIDHWLYEGEEETGGLLDRPSPQHKRRNSQSDALALIGFGSGIVAETPRVIEDFQPNAIEIRNADRTQRISILTDAEAVEDLSIEIVTPHSVVATIGGNLTTSVTGNVIATIGGNLTTDVTGNVSETIGGTLEANVTGNTTLTTPLLTLNGDMRIEGAITVSGDMSTDSKGSYNDHIHPKGSLTGVHGALLSGDTGAI